MGTRCPTREAGLFGAVLLLQRTPAPNIAIASTIPATISKMFMTNWRFTLTPIKLESNFRCEARRNFVIFAVKSLNHRGCEELPQRTPRETLSTVTGVHNDRGGGALDDALRSNVRRRASYGSSRSNRQMHTLASHRMLSIPLMFWYLSVPPVMAPIEKPMTGANPNSSLNGACP